MKRAISHSLLALSAFAMSSTAMAEPGGTGLVPSGSSARGHSKDAFMSAYDTNGDGKVSSAEFIAIRGPQHGSFDLNGDGKVDEEEYVTEYKTRLERDLAERREMQLKQAHVRYGVLDTDKNKNMTLAEFNDSGKRMFSRLDSNKDGVVDQNDGAENY
ncbi:hypothetical protein ABVV53_08605 [Novosphingobium sp. RD2P27]|uniref:EF-hand domain-containing protein n=1 Tax=Novosphingobium kalidii TaxID=3230299 RepID=A0ABV2D128_9SPHN